MSDIYQDTLPPDVSMGQLHQGVVITPPTDSASFMEVQIPAIHPDLSFQCRWQARDNMSLPADGDICLIAFDNDNVPWACAWWPLSRRPTISVGETLPSNPIDGDLAILTYIDSMGMRWWMQYDADAMAWYPVGARVTTSPFGNGPPSNPQSGDIWIAYNVGGIGSGVRWQFQYNAVASTYKWEFIGGPPVCLVQNESPAFNPPGGWNGPYYPQWTTPRAGEYDVSLDMYLQGNSGNNAQIVAGYATTMGDAQNVCTGASIIAGTYAGLAATPKTVTAAANGQFSVYMWTGTTGNLVVIRITAAILPKRIS